MKLFELVTGIFVHLNEEELELLNIIQDNEELEERDLVVAQSLINKGIVERIDDNVDDKFKIIEPQDVWRD